MLLVRMVVLGRWICKEIPTEERWAAGGELGRESGRWSPLISGEARRKGGRERRREARGRVLVGVVRAEEGVGGVGVGGGADGSDSGVSVGV